MVTYFLWELSLLALAYGIAAFAQLASTLSQQNRTDEAAEFTTNGLILKLLLGAAIPQTLAFWGVVTAYSFYWATASCALLSGGLWYVLWRAGKLPALLAETRSLLAIFVCVAVVLLSAAVSNAVTLIIELDSIYYSHWIVAVANGLETPFDFYYNYNALWQSAYLPSFVLTNSVHLFALTSLQTALLFSLAAYLLARAAGLTILMSALLALTGLVGGHLWGPIHTGVGTLKNDTISAAGVLLLILFAMRFVRAKQLDGSLAILLLGGLVFASVKSSGPAQAVVVILLLVLFFRKEVLKINVQSITLLGLVGLLFMATSGVYYARNLYEFGSPFAPFIVNMGPITLPGTFDPTGTRLIDQLHDIEVWKLFFNIGSYMPNRTASSVLLLFVVFICVPFLLYLLKHNTTSRDRKMVMMSWLVTFVLWLLYLQTPWSSGSDPATETGRILYIAEHASFRYVIAQVQLLLTLGVLALCLAGTIGRVLGFTLVGIELLGRLYYHYWGEYGGALFEVTPLVGLLSFGLVAFIVALIVIFRVKPFPAVSLLMLLFGCAAPWIYEQNKIAEGWQPMLALSELTAGQESCAAYSLNWHDSHSYTPLSVLVYPLALSTTWSNSRCRYLGLRNIEQLGEQHHEQDEVLANLVVVINLYGSYEQAFSADDIKQLNEALNTIGYNLLFDQPASLVYGRFLRDSTKLPNPDVPISYFPRFPPELLAEAGEHIFATVQGVFRLEAGKWYRYEFGETHPVTLRDTVNGTVGQFGYGPAGIEIPEPAQNPNMVEHSPNLYQSIMSEDGIWTFNGSQFEITETDGEGTIQIVATADTPWLGVFIAGAALPGYEIYQIEAEFSSTDSVLISMHSWDFEGESSRLATNDFNLPDDGSRVRESHVFSLGDDHSDRDYVGIIAQDIKAGQQFSIHGLRLYMSEWPQELVIAE